MPFVPPKPGEYDYKFYGGITTAEVKKSFERNFTFASPLVDDTERVVYSDRSEFAQVKDAKILIVGGGGTANLINGADVEVYDQLWTMNYGFNHRVLKSKRIDHLWVGFEVSLSQLQSYLFNTRSYNKPMLGFLYGKRHIDNRNIINHNLLPSSHKYCIYPKLFTILGVGVRMIWWAGYLGAKEVHFIGFDGLPAIEKRNHAFQTGKGTLPSVAKFNMDFARELFKYQYDKFWEKMKQEFPNTKCFNLAHDNNPYHKAIQ